MTVDDEHVPHSEATGMSEPLKILVTCPPMFGMIDSFQGLFPQHGLTVTAPKVVQPPSPTPRTCLAPRWPRHRHGLCHRPRARDL